MRSAGKRIFMHRQKMAILHSQLDRLPSVLEVASQRSFNPYQLIRAQEVSLAADPGAGSARRLIIGHSQPHGKCCRRVGAKLRR